MTHSKISSFRKLREDRGLSRAQVAEIAETDVSTICRWEINGVPKRGAAKFVIQEIQRLPKVSTKGATPA
jgi:DNA-binding transcriptional regulator YiaG